MERGVVARNAPPAAHRYESCGYTCIRLDEERVMANQHTPTLDTNNVPDAEGRDRDLRRNRRPMPGATPRRLQTLSMSRSWRTRSRLASGRRLTATRNTETAPFRTR